MLHPDTPYNQRPYQTIYLDMDGLLANFHLEAIRQYMRAGFRFKELNHHGTPLSLSNDTLNAAWQNKPGQSLQKAFGLPVGDDFWKPIDREPMFWDMIQPYSHAKALVELVQPYCEHLVIISYAHRTPDCYRGKRAWLDAHGFHTKEFITCQEKWRLSRRDTLLIDDHDRQCNNFAKPQCRPDTPCEAAIEIDQQSKLSSYDYHTCHGDALLFPTWWNDNYQYATTPLSYITTFLNDKANLLPTS